MPLPLWQIVPLVILAGLWLTWFIVPSVRSWRTKEHDSIGSFRQQLSAMGRAPEEVLEERASGSQLATSPAKWRAQSVHARRRQIFMALVMAAVASLVLAVIFRGLFVGLHLTMDVLLGTFVAFANRAGARTIDSRETIIYLDEYGHEYDESPYDDYEEYDDDLLVKYG